MVEQFTKNDFNEEIKNGVYVVDFYADWCGPCRQMAPVIEELSEEYASKAKFLKVNVDNYNDLCMQYRISTIPRFYIFKDGEIKKMFVGTTSKDIIARAIEEC